jgi:hypothetical protein
MAMHARLIAAIADIDLQRIEPAAPERRKIDLIEKRPGIAHQRSRITGPAFDIPLSTASKNRVQVAIDEIGAPRRPLEPRI